MVQASDRTSEEAAQFSTAKVIITVPRDQNPPRFQGTYETRITENVAVNSSVISVRATDADRKGDIVYMITGVYPAESFFWIENSNGVLYIRNSLKADSLSMTKYIVSRQLNCN